MGVTSNGPWKMITNRQERPSAGHDVDRAGVEVGIGVGM
jgi:hypothetical protein